MIRGCFRLLLCIAVVISLTMVIVQVHVHDNPERAAQILCFAGVLLIILTPPRDRLKAPPTHTEITESALRMTLRLKDERERMPMAVPFGKRTPPSQRVNE